MIAGGAFAQVAAAGFDASTRAAAQGVLFTDTAASSQSGTALFNVTQLFLAAHPTLTATENLPFIVDAVAAALGALAVARAQLLNPYSGTVQRAFV